MATVLGGSGGNISFPSLRLGNLLTGGAASAADDYPISTPTQFRVQFDLTSAVTRFIDIFGSGFTYDAQGFLSTGTITRILDSTSGGTLDEYQTRSSTSAGPGGARADIT